MFLGTSVRAGPCLDVPINTLLSYCSFSYILLLLFLFHMFVYLAFICVVKIYLI